MEEIYSEREQSWHHDSREEITIPFYRTLEVLIRDLTLWLVQRDKPHSPIKTLVDALNSLERILHSSAPKVYPYGRRRR